MREAEAKAVIKGQLLDLVEKRNEIFRCSARLLHSMRHVSVKKEKHRSPPTDYSDVAREGSVGVSEALVTVETPASEPRRGGGAGFCGNRGQEGLCCGQARRGRSR